MGKQRSLDVENSVGFEECLCTKPKPKIPWSPLFAQKDYSKKVLVGNWFEDTCVYHKNKHNHTSEYLSEYVKKPNTTLPRSVIWDATINGQGHDGLFGNCIDKAEEAYMTSYYLSYQLLPEIAKQNPDKPPPQSKHVDELPKKDEHFLNYGNQVNYGLGEYKKFTWELEKNDPRSTVGSTHEVTYVEPEKELYKFRRWILGRGVKGKYGIEYSPRSTDHPRESQCNPITWEC